ncbi:MAG: hypothetical protein GXO03_02905 [Aquificae bacterium]|nr:hypothetical protein [Aquificota bacterium]
MRELYKKLKAYESLRQLFGVVSVLSAGRLKKSRASAYALSFYAEALKESFTRLLSAYPELLPPLTGRPLLVVFGSEMALTRGLKRKLAAKARELQNAELLVLGELPLKGRSLKGYFTRHWRPELFKKLARELKRSFLSGREVYLLYARVPAEKAETLLSPSEPTGGGRHESFYAPASAAPVPVPYARLELTLERFLPPPLTKAEPVELERPVFNELLDRYAEAYLSYSALLHLSALHLTRMRKSRGAQERVTDRIKLLKRELSKRRQERIDAELRDTVGAVLALEEKLYRFYEPPRLELEKELEPALKELLRERFKDLTVVEKKGLLGFRVVEGGRVLEGSAIKLLRLFTKSLKEDLS